MAKTRKVSKTRHRDRVFEAPETGKTPGKIELLAPAGSPATWAAAVEAGADAVYLGMKSFSARAFAANFSMPELARIVDLSHERGVRVFVAFNALLKEKELTQAVRSLEQLAAIKPDALILQDMGLCRLIKKHFPFFELHASTLMAVHNQPGLEILNRMGFDRAVLSRELTLGEIERLVGRSPLGLEIFIHGALCFSFSGLCLLSSFLGGKGSLRGACTQPCRRNYQSGKKRGYWFSPSDFDSSTLIGDIRRLPLKALKIEGRMKGAQYVYHVVKAYRLLLDSPENDMNRALSEAEKLIEAAMGRHRSTGFLLSNKGEEGLVQHRAATSGRFLGKVRSSGPKGGLVDLKDDVELGDRLRVQFRKDGEQQAFTLKEMIKDGDAPDRTPDSAAAESTIWLKAPFSLSEGDLVFKVDSGRMEKNIMESPLVKSLKEGGKEPAQKDRGLSPAYKKALSDLEVKKATTTVETQKKSEIWFKISRPEEVMGLSPLKPDRVILPINPGYIKRIAGMRRRLDRMFYRIVWSLPTLLFNPSALEDSLAHLARMGANEFMVSNLGHLPLVQKKRPGPAKKTVVYSDYRLNCLNTQAESQLADLNVAAVTLCLENDEENLGDVLSRPGPTGRLFYLYGRPPLFTSRFSTPGIKDNLPIESPRREKFRVREEKGIFTLVAEQPIFFSPILKYKSLGGIRAFIIDLEYDPHPLKTAKEILDAVHRGRPLRNASRFNWKRGLY